jgi:hypothetical protein
MYARLAARLPGCLRSRDSVEDGRRILAEQLASPRLAHIGFSFASR